MKDLKTVILAPTKEEAERMVKIAYYLDKKFIRPIDVVDMGIDFYRLKEFGEVRMSKSQAKLKPHTSELWGRMTPPMQAMFLWSYFCQGVDQLKMILEQLEPVVMKNVRQESVQLDVILRTMASKLPSELQAKIQEGFGREWGK